MTKVNHTPVIHDKTHEPGRATPERLGLPTHRYAARGDPSAHPPCFASARERRGPPKLAPSHATMKYPAFALASSCRMLMCQIG